MAMEERVLRADLEDARRLAVKLRENVQNSTPELVGYWSRQLEEAEADVAQLARKLGSPLAVSS